jgi:WD40 repeat protein
MSAFLRHFVLTTCLILLTALSGHSQSRSGKARELSPLRTDAYGDPLPAGAIRRLGTIRFRAGNYLACAALSPDGKWIAAGGQRGFVHLLDASTGKERRSFQADFGGITFVAFTPDGKSLATTGHGSPITLWDPHTGQKKRQLEQVRNFHGGGFVFSADGTALAVGSDGFGQGSHAFVWQVDTGKQLAHWELPYDHRMIIALSPTGKLLAASGQILRDRINRREQAIQLMDVATGKELRRITTGGHFVGALAFSRDGKTLASGDGSGTIAFWDVATGKLHRRVATRRGIGFSLVSSPDGKMLAAGDYAGNLQVWDVTNGKRLGGLDNSDLRITSLAFPGAGKVLACGVGSQSIRVWDVLSHRELAAQAGHQAAVSAVAFAKNDREICSADSEGNIRVWNAANGKLLRQVDIRDVEFGRRHFNRGSASFSPHGHYLVSQSNFGQGISLWDIAAGKVIFDVMGSGRFYHQGMPVAFSPDDMLLAIPETDGTANSINFWNISTGANVGQLKTPKGMAGCLAFDPRGNRLAAVISLGDRFRNESGQIHLWDLNAGKEIWHTGQINPAPQSLVFSPDGKAMAGGSFNSVHIWAAATGTELIRLQASGNLFSAPVFSPDGRLLAAAEWNQQVEKTSICLWEMASGTVRSRFEGHRGLIQSLAFSSDGRTLASASHDTTVLVWDIAGNRIPTKARPRTLSPKETEDLWSTLATKDASQAYPALLSLVDAPEDALRLLAKRLVAAPVTDPQAIAVLIADLDHKSFARRQKASRKLESLGEVAAPAIQMALAGNPSLEVSKRLDALLNKLNSALPTAEVLRQLRGLEVLERIGRGPAREILKKVAQGASGSRQTEAANAALARLARRSGR